MAINFGTVAEAGRRGKLWRDRGGEGWSAVDRHAKVVNHAEINTRRGHILHALVRTLKPKRGRYY